MAGNGTSVGGRVGERFTTGAIDAAVAGAANAVSAADRFAEDLFDELLPPSLDWRHLVRRYPRTTVALAAAAGFWVGRKKSGLVLAALTSYVAAQFGDAIADLGDGGPVGPGH